MGFNVSIEADFGAEKLMNVHPDGYITGGNAVFAFLSGLSLYCNSPSKDESDSLGHVYLWYRQLEALHQQPLCERCRELLDCMWNDGGDTTQYQEDEYEFYLHRVKNSGVLTLTETEFQAMVRDYDSHWQPIPSVIGGVRLLLNLFRQNSLEPLEGFYHPDDTIPDFEALLANLEILDVRGNEEVRLNFS